MGQIIFKIWYMIAVLPFLILLEGYDMLKAFLEKRNLWWIWPYLLLAVLILLLIILLMLGYR